MYLEKDGKNMLLLVLVASQYLYQLKSCYFLIDKSVSEPFTFWALQFT